MTSGADLFVVCKQCGSEVSPYITECPYCGHRLRRRAPKLPRVNADAGRSAGACDGLRLPRAAIVARDAARRARGPRLARRMRRSRWWRSAARRGWCATPNRTSTSTWRSSARCNGDWWKLFTNQFAYLNGLYAFITLLAVAIFGWLLERRHGPAVVLALFLGAGAAGALVAQRRVRRCRS